MIYKLNCVFSKKDLGIQEFCLIFDHVLERHQRRRHNNDVVSCEDFHPVDQVGDGFMTEDDTGCLHGSYYSRDCNGEEENRKQHFTHAGILGDGGKNRSRGNKPQGSQNANREEPGYFRPKGQIEEDDEKGDHKDFHKQHEQQTGEEFTQINGALVDGEHHQGLKISVFAFRSERAVQAQSTCERESDPENAGPQLQNLFLIRSHREIKRHQDEHRKYEHRTERFASPFFQTNIFLKYRPRIFQECLHGVGACNVGVGRFELPTSRSRTERANRAALHPED